MFMSYHKYLQFEKARAIKLIEQLLYTKCFDYIYIFFSCVLTISLQSSHYILFVKAETESQRN